MPDSRVRRSRMRARIPAEMLRRAALGLWFCGLAVLGFLRSWMKTRHDGAFAADIVAMAWFGGSMLLAVLGLVLLARVAFRPRG